MLALAATPGSPETLEGGCGNDPSFICEQVYDLTNGNEDLTQIIDWMLHQPLTILFILLAAWVVTRIARRYVRRVVRQLVAPDRSATTLTLSASSQPNS